VSTHLPLQTICPTGQSHLPAVQTWLAAHTIPQAPQLLRSLFLSTQPPLHSISGDEQEFRHFPALQT